MVSWKLMLMVMSAVCGAQQYVPPPPPLTVDPCAATVNPLLPKDMARKVPVCPPHTAVQPAAGAETPGLAAGKFPFPGATAPITPSSDARPSTADQFPYPGNAPAVAPSNAPSTSKIADQFPYPGETSKSPDATPEGNLPRYVPDVPLPEEGSSSSSSSSGSSATGDATPNAPNDEDNAAHRDDGSSGRARGRRALPKISAISPEDRVSEDLEVAKFYTDHGNFQAAYLRARDAIKLMPEDAESHFVLAQAAEKLKRKDEAAAEYTAFLKLDPAGPRTAAAQRALAQLR